jgi:hypothetical protein
MSTQDGTTQGFDILRQDEDKNVEVLPGASSGGLEQMEAGSLCFSSPGKGGTPSLIVLFCWVFGLTIVLLI